MKKYLINKANKKNSNSTDIVRSINTGKYGPYCKSPYGGNDSVKTLLNGDWEEEFLSEEDYDKITKLADKRKKRMEKAYFDAKIKERFEQVEICLKAEPVEIVNNSGGNPFVNEVANLSESKMIDAYRGCAKGMAYVKDNKVVAFHYGYDAPSNIPINCEYKKVEFSCTQICF